MSVRVKNKSAEMHKLPAVLWGCRELQRKCMRRKEGMDGTVMRRTGGIAGVQDYSQEVDSVLLPHTHTHIDHLLYISCCKVAFTLRMEKTALHDTI